MNKTFNIRVTFLDEEATGGPCPMCDDPVYMGSKRTNVPICITYEDETGLHQRHCQTGFCSACADVVLGLIEPPAEGTR